MDLSKKIIALISYNEVKFTITELIHSAYKFYNVYIEKKEYMQNIISKYEEIIHNSKLKFDIITGTEYDIKYYGFTTHILHQIGTAEDKRPDEVLTQCMKIIKEYIDFMEAKNDEK